MEKEKMKCSICGAEFEGFGHNAEPVNNGRCCDKCNFDVVLPARIIRSGTVIKRNPDAKVGDKIHIVNMEGEPAYTDKEGVVQHIDSIGQLHGTWGGCGLLPDVDTYYVKGGAQ